MKFRLREVFSNSARSLILKQVLMEITWCISWRIAKKMQLSWEIETKGCNLKLTQEKWTLSPTNKTTAPSASTALWARLKSRPLLLSQLIQWDCTSPSSKTFSQCPCEIGISSEQGILECHSSKVTDSHWENLVALENLARPRCLTVPFASNFITSIWLTRMWGNLRARAWV